MIVDWSEIEGAAAVRVGLPPRIRRQGSYLLVWDGLSRRSMRPPKPPFSSATAWAGAPGGERIAILTDAPEPSLFALAVIGFTLLKLLRRKGYIQAVGGTHVH